MDFARTQKVRMFIMTKRLQELDKININVLHSKVNDIEEDEAQVKVIPNSVELPSISQEELDKSRSDADTEKKMTIENMNNSSPVARGKNIKYIG